MHAAYQFLVKTYVDDVKKKRNDDGLFLSIEQIKANNAKRRNSTSVLSEKSASPNLSRRGSNVSMMKEDKKDIKLQDQKRRKEKEEKKIAR